MGINYEVLSKEEEKAGVQIDKALRSIRQTGEAYALVVEKDTFETWPVGSGQKSVGSVEYEMSREEAIRTVAASIPADAVIVSTTGMISRELFEYRTAMGEGHERDFLTVGSMGHASMIALGIALQHPERRVYCFDGDGASIMHLGNMTIVGSKRPENYVHIIFNNGAHDSVGGQPTVGHQIDLVEIAHAMNYNHAERVSRPEELETALAGLSSGGLQLIEVRVKKGNRKDLGRPTTTPVENKEAFMRFLEK